MHRVVSVGVIARAQRERGCMSTVRGTTAVTVTVLSCSLSTTVATRATRELTLRAELIQVRNELQALLATSTSCETVLIKADAGWNDTFCMNNNGCSIGLGQSASLAVPGVLGMLALAWAGRRLARGRFRARRPRTTG